RRRGSHLGAKRDARGGRRAARRAASRSAGLSALCHLALRPPPRRSRHVAGQPPAGGTPHRQPAAELAPPPRPPPGLCLCGLAGFTACFAGPIALTLGITAAIWRESWYDRAVGVLSVSIISVPEFLVATLAVLIFAVKLRWLPALSYASDIRSVGQLLRSFA